MAMRGSSPAIGTMAHIVIESQLAAPMPNPRPIRSRPVYEGWRTHRYGPRVMTVCSASTWINVLNEAPSASTAQALVAKPIQIVASPAMANMRGAGVARAGTQPLTSHPMTIAPITDQATMRRVPRSRPALALFSARSRVSRPISKRNQHNNVTWNGADNVDMPRKGSSRALAGTARGAFRLAASGLEGPVAGRLVEFLHEDLRAGQILRCVDDHHPLLVLPHMQLHRPRLVDIVEYGERP